MSDRAIRDELVRVRETDAPAGETYLTLRRWVGAEHEVIGPAAEVTTAELCDVANQEAEGDNFHAFVGAIDVLAEIVERHAGAAAALAIAREIVERHGGLHRLVRR